MSIDRSINGSIFKLVIVGDARVGKSQLKDRILNDRFLEEYNTSTVGATINMKGLSLPEEKRVNLQIWDTGGSERYQEITPLYFSQSSAILLAFDLSDATSFKNLPRHLDRIRKGYSHVPIFLVGTKSDETPAVEQAAIDAFVQDKGLQDYFATSAKENVGVNQLFEAVAGKLVAAAAAPAPAPAPAPVIIEERKQNPSSPGFLRRHIGKILAGAVMLGGIAALVVFTGGLALTLLPLAKGLIVAGAVLVGVLGGVIAGRRKDKEDANQRRGDEDPVLEEMGRSSHSEIRRIGGMSPGIHLKVSDENLHADTGHSDRGRPVPSERIVQASVPESPARRPSSGHSGPDDKS